MQQQDREKTSFKEVKTTILNANLQRSENNNVKC